MDLNDISPELLEKARNCKTPEEIVQLAKEEGLDLSEEQLQAVSGGDDWFGPCDSYVCTVYGD